MNKKPTYNRALLEAYKTTVRDLEIASRNQTFVEFLLSRFLNIGTNYDREIERYEKLIKELESLELQ
jgi:hypothetical protein